MNTSIQRSFGNWLYQLSNLVLIPLALLLGSVVLMCLWLYCLAWRRQHSWVRVSEAGVSPVRYECCVCGKRQ